MSPYRDIKDTERAKELFTDCLVGFGVKPKYINTRQQESTFARCAFVSIIRELEPQVSLRAIGEFLQEQIVRDRPFDHTSVHNMAKQAKILSYALDHKAKEFKRVCDRIEFKYIDGKGAVDKKQRIYKPLTTPV